MNDKTTEPPALDLGDLEGVVLLGLVLLGEECHRSYSKDLQ